MQTDNKYYIVSLIAVIIVVLLILLAILDFIRIGQEIPAELWGTLAASLAFVTGLHIPFNNKKE